MDFLTNFSEFIQQHQLFNEEDRVLLAVSGGKDSVMMTRLFSKSPYRFAIAHCNFQLRGAQANEDALFVRDLALKLEVPYYESVFNTNSYAEKKKISIQMAARELRYDWLEKIRVEQDFQYIAVGHHQTDSVETVLINMVRGTGIAGLHGILSKRARIVRPLLAFTGDEVAHFMAQNAIPFCEDHTNLETKYARNKIRLEVLPALKEINPTLEKTFSKASTRFYALELFLNQQIKQLKEELFFEKENGVFHIDTNPLKVHIKNTFVLYELFKAFGFTEEVLRDLVQNLENPQTGSLFYSNSHQILIDRDTLILQGKSTNELSKLSISSIPMEFSWYDTNYRISYSTEIPKDFKECFRTNKIILNADAIQLPLEVRSWNEGDSFYPLGLGGRKKISDFLIDQKIPLNKKLEIPILVNGNQEIMAVSLRRIDEKYKITTETKKVIIFEQL